MTLKDIGLTIWYCLPFFFALAHIVGETTKDFHPQPAPYLLASPPSPHPPAAPSPTPNAPQNNQSRATPPLPGVMLLMPTIKRASDGPMTKSASIGEICGQTSRRSAVA
jgi:hypothetical protein